MRENLYLGLLTALFLLLLEGCSTCFFVPDPPCPPPPSARAPSTLTFSCDSPTVEPIIPDSVECLILADLIDIALQNNPQTRQAWFNAKSAAADLGIARGAYLPTIEFEYQVERDSQVIFNTVATVATGSKFFQTTYGPTLSTNYLLLDFGGRNAKICSAVHALEALNWTYNWEVQTIMLNVIKNYYNYINAKAVIAIDKMNVEDFQRIVEVATSLREGGVKNISDELQAKTNLVQAQITLEKDLGQFYITQVNLAESLGIPLDYCFCVEDMPDNFDCESVEMSMEAVINAAKKNRADLESARATILQRRADIHVARSAFWPNLSTQISGQQIVNRGSGAGINATAAGTQFSVALTLDWNVFNGYQDVNAIRKAEAIWQAAQAELDEEELEAFQIALTDYYQFSTNSIVLKHSYAYLEVAQENYNVAFTSYRAGINTILDVLAANHSLNMAREQLVNAKTNWLTSIANLTYDTGGITFEGVCESNHTVCLPDYPEALD